MSGKRIVLLHGWGAETKKLEPLKQELEKLGWQVLLPKLAGFEKPAPKKIWGIKEYSDYVYEGVRKKFGDNKFYVFGHSFGGRIAIKIAASDFRQVVGVILCAAGGISRNYKIARLIFYSMAKSGKIFLLVPQIAKRFRKLLYKAAHEHDYEKTQGIMREIFKKVIAEDIKPLL